MMILPKYAVSDVIGQIKQYTSSRLRGRFAWLGNVYWKERVEWSPGYFVSTVGLDEKQITKYMRWQRHQDSGQAKFEL
jgi:putative transposase